MVDDDGGGGGDDGGGGNDDGLKPIVHKVSGKGWVERRGERVWKIEGWKEVWTNEWTAV